MINRAVHITTLIFRNISDLIRFRFILSAAFMLLPPALIHAQVINNYGAAINITPGTAVVTKDMTNTSGPFNARFQNNGTINLSGDYTNSISSMTEGNGTYRLGGNWTNNGIFNHDLSTVVFNGSAEQLITKPTPETFYNLSIENTGALSGLTVRLQNLVQVIGTL